MDQYDLTIKKCSLHDKESQIYCKNKVCQRTLSCFACIKDKYHINHLEDVLNFKDDQKILHSSLEQIKQKCEVLFTKLDNFSQEANQLFQVLIKGISQKFTITNIDCFNSLTFYKQNEFFCQQQYFNDYQEQFLQEMKCHTISQIKKLKTRFNFYNQKNYIIIKQMMMIFNNQMQNIGRVKDFFFELIGVESYQNHQLDDALINLNNALIYNPKSLNALSLKAETLRLQRKFDDAIEFFDKALAIDDKHVFSLFGKGESLRLQKKLDDSITWYNKALDIDSQHSGSWYGRGEALRMKKQFTEAFKCFNEVLNKQENQNNPIFLSSQGACLVGLGKLEQAEKFLNQAYTLDPNNKFCETWLAKCKAQKQT